MILLSMEVFGRAFRVLNWSSGMYWCELEIETFEYFMFAHAEGVWKVVTLSYCPRKEGLEDSRIGGWRVWIGSGKMGCGLKLVWLLILVGPFGRHGMSWCLTTVLAIRLRLGTELCSTTLAFLKEAIKWNRFITWVKIKDGENQHLELLKLTVMRWWIRVLQWLV